ncbi:Helix-turn-helix domain-containing protein [Actinacidiphila alni]|uniref:Helix-turn-helix domain-containing protein n=1 Tax=Actinacidiphila alni TaxID=380248 RepID=A0A1I2IRF0_9ACTN|nr:helix-turn-helix transcriptional regulator [Actinacidiphila alni]SFF44895.1 Helix-turn-helix domain-containing protein [Actinacidiphila alni]
MAHGTDDADDGGTTPAGGEPETSDSLRTFGAFVQGLREFRGLGREEFASRVGFSKHTIASIEQGRRMPDVDFVERAEPVLGDTGALRRAFEHVGRQPGLASWFRQWARLERSAISLYNYECRLVPGLLQTEAYARAASEDVPPLVSEAAITERVTARLARQALLSTDREPPCAFSFILEQAVLERHTGGEDVTRELLDHLLDRTALRWNVVLQIMPLRQPTHAGVDGPIALLETPANRWFAYSEGQENGRLIAEAKSISTLQQRYAKLRSQALTPDDTRDLLERMRGAL